MSERSALVTWGVRAFGVLALGFIALLGQYDPITVVVAAAVLAPWAAFERGQTPMWSHGLLAIALLGGVGISIYMTGHHEIELYGSADMQGSELIGCAESEGVDCGAVNTSPWSEVWGVPTFTWGAATYVGMLLLLGLVMTGREALKPVLVLAGIGSIAFSFFLYYISIAEIGSVCLWCMRLYVINALIPFLVLTTGLSTSARPTPASGGISVAAFGTAALIAIITQQSYRATLLGDGGEAGEKAAEKLAEAEEVSEEQRLAYEDPQGPPPTIRYDITTEDGNPSFIQTQPDDAWKGNPEATVAIIEFADFECGYCKRASAELHRIFEAYKDEIVFVYKHFPMDPKCNPGVNNPRHRYACLAHEASVCAQEKGKFWAYHDLLYKNRHALRADNLTAYAEAVGIDRSEFIQCMREGRGRAKVTASGEEGKVAETHGTPRIWIAGQLYRSGSSAVQMARAIEAALGRTGAEANTRAAAMADEINRIEPIPADVPDMQHITYGSLDFYIDTFEAGVSDEGAATSGKGQVPGHDMSWFAANDACEAAGKRMCTEEEWIAVCQSAAAVDDDGNGQFAEDMIEGNSYPYGDFHEKRRCWEDHQLDRRRPKEEQVNWRPVYTGEMPGCVTEAGVYDMAGNVEEWVGESPDKAVLLGGAFDTPDDKARCYRRNDTFGAGYSNMRTGFRCCKNGG